MTLDVPADIFLNVGFRKAPSFNWDFFWILPASSSWAAAWTSFFLLNHLITDWINPLSPTEASRFGPLCWATGGLLARRHPHEPHGQCHQSSWDHWTWSSCTRLGHLWGTSSSCINADAGGFCFLFSQAVPKYVHPTKVVSLGWSHEMSVVTVVIMTMVIWFYSQIFHQMIPCVNCCFWWNRSLNDCLIFEMDETVIYNFVFLKVSSQPFQSSGPNSFLQ